MNNNKLPFPQPLTDKYLPKLVGQFIGLHKVKRIMEAFIVRPFESSWFFWGPSGIGKTTMALVVAKSMNAEIHHIPSQQCDLDAVELICRTCQFVPLNGGWHIVICDEADKMTAPAQLALLSKLDSTARPPNTIFFFTANAKHGLEDRFLSRCNVMEFERESVENDLVRFLKRVYKAEGGRHPLSFDKIAQDANLNVRDALSRLEVELLLGNDRSDLPAEKEIIENEAHAHICIKCTKRYEHKDDACRLPFRHVCPDCGGALSAGSAAAKKAWETMRKKKQAEINNAVQSAVLEIRNPKRKAG